MSDNEVVLGIDLGTSYSVVSIYQNNNPKVFQDEIGNKIIPSFIAFENDKKMLVGEDAKTILGKKGIAVIYDAKRLIGRTYDDPVVTKDKVNWPFKIILDKNTNKTKIVVEVKKLRNNEDKTKDFNIKEVTGSDKNLSFKEKKPKQISDNPNLSANEKVPTVEKEFTPEEISSYILKKLKDMAEADLKKKVKKAVITVPAYFNNSQREST